MPITNYDCPECGDPVHTDGLIDGVHHLGCGHQFSDEYLRKRGWL